MRNGRKRIKLAVLLFAMIFAVGAAFAATNGVLTFGGTVRIAGMSPQDVRLEFNHADSHRYFYGVETWATIYDNSGMGHNNALRYGIHLHDPAIFLEGWYIPHVGFTFVNTGSVPVRLVDVSGGSSATNITLFLPNGSVFSIEEVLWQNAVLYPGEVMGGMISLCHDHVYEAFHHSWDELIEFESYLELHYEVWR